MTLPPRWLPQEPFPIYAYVAGKFPHPTRDANGHRNARSPHDLGIPEAHRWKDCWHYLRGIDLFNYGFYWEAHEAWETLWHAAGRKGQMADYLKGLIALAAAGVKAREGRLAGVRSHALRALNLFTQTQERLENQSREFMGLNLSALIALTRQILDAPEQVLNTSDAPVVVIFSSLIPEEFRNA